MIDEFNRLRWYAKGMGVKVSIHPYVKGTDDASTWSSEGRIVLYRTKTGSRLQMVLSLIHELGHHKDYIRMGKRLPWSAEKAYDKETPSKKDRQLILKEEIRGTKYWEEIYKDTGCTFHINHLFKNMKYDIWWYEVWAEKGHGPTAKEAISKKQQLRKIYKC